MRIDVIGPVRVLRDGEVDVTPRPAQQRAALAALVASGPEGIGVDDLVDVLWPGGAPSTNALQAVVSKLRRAVAPAEVVLARSRYRLVGAYSSDLADIERAHAAGDWDSVEALVRGPVLADLAAEPFAEAVRRRVGALVSTARHRRLEAVAHGPHPDAALAELEALSAAEPHDERWWAVLMTARYRAGDQAGALHAFQRARSVLADELGLEPGPELRRLEQQILDHAAELGQRAAPVAAADTTPVARGGRLPARMASFVGRAVELAELRELIARHRLVTLLGPGGVGKTTTALELARSAASAHFVELAPQADPESIVRAFTRAIGLPDVEQAGLGSGGIDPVERVVDALSAREVILVVDNCEHVVAETARVVHGVLAGCPGVRIIATSREALGVPGEFVFPLPSLPSPDAVELFVDRAQARAAGAAVALSPPERLAALCDRLDGLPLAIELAAARLRTMTVDELIDRLDDRFAVLSAGARTVEPRQQTLRSVVDWSHELLDPEERIVFRRLAAFVGGASPAAAELTCSGSAPDGTVIDPGSVREIVQRLVDKSLVVVEHLDDGPRWTMLETLRDYANERLLQSGELERVLVRHAQHFADLLAGATRGLVGRDQPVWFAMIRRERRNLDAALATAVARDDAQLALELTMPLGWYFFMVGETDAGVVSLGDALGCGGPSDPDLRAGALGLYGWLLSNTPELESAVAATTEAMAMLDRVADPWVRGMVVNTYAMTALFSGHLDIAEAHLPRLREVADAAGDPWIRAITDLVEGEIRQYRGDIGRAEELFSTSAAEFERVGDQFAYALAITEASEIAELVGHYDRAADMVRRGLAIADAVGFSGHPLAMRARLANIEVLRGDLDEAEALHRSLLDDDVARGMHWIMAMSWIGLASISRRRGRFDEAAAFLDEAWNLPRTHTVPFTKAIAQVARGYLADQLGDGRRALEHQLDGLETAVQLHTPRGLAYSLEGVAGALAVGAGDAGCRLAARLLGAADRLRRESGGSLPDAERYDVGRAESRLRAVLGAAGFDGCVAAGAEEPVARLIAEATAFRPV